MNVSLAGKLKVSGNRIIADFGTQGIGGNRNTGTGNGYYRFGVDADRNGTQGNAKALLPPVRRHQRRPHGQRDRPANVNADQGKTGTNLAPTSTATAS